MKRYFETLKCGACGKFSVMFVILVCCYMTYSMFFLVEGIQQTASIVIVQGHTKEFYCTTIYGWYTHKMYFSANMLFETMQNFYML